MAYQERKDDRIVNATYLDLYVYQTDTRAFPLSLVKQPFQVGHLNQSSNIIQVASGLGGCFTLEYLENIEGEFYFRVINPGFTNLIYCVRPE